MPVYNVQQQSGVTTPYGDRAGPAHPMREDLVGEYMVLERGTQPVVQIKDVYELDGIRCFVKFITGVASGSTALVPFDDLEPSDYMKPPTPLPHDRWSYV